MYLFYTDETNLNPDNSDFFIYSGILIPDDNAYHLSRRVDALRLQYGYGPDAKLKFNTHDNPRRRFNNNEIITPDDFRRLKQSVIKLARMNDVKIITSMISHKIAVNPDKARTYEINRCVMHFNRIIRNEEDCGLVFIDTFTNREGEPSLREICEEKFMEGILYEDGSHNRLERIVGFHPSYINGSHFSSIIDIIIGSLRYAINHRETSTSPLLLNQLRDMFIYKTIEDTDVVCEESLFFSPRHPGHRYRAEYIELKRYLSDNGILTEQNFEPL